MVDRKNPAVQDLINLHGLSRNPRVDAKLTEAAQCCKYLFVVLRQEQVASAFVVTECGWLGLESFEAFTEKALDRFAAAALAATDAVDTPLIELSLRERARLCFSGRASAWIRPGELGFLRYSDTKTFSLRELVVLSEINRAFRGKRYDCYDEQALTAKVREFSTGSSPLSGSTDVVILSLGADGVPELDECTADN